MKINLNIDVQPEEIIELLKGLSGHPSTTAIEPEETFPSPFKPSPDEREFRKGLYVAQVAKGINPAPLMRSLTWEDFFEPHELNEDGPIVELFVTNAVDACSNKKSGLKRLARKTT